MPRHCDSCDILLVPWTEDQVKALNAWQTDEFGVPYTWLGRVLIATPDGWLDEGTGKIVGTWTHMFSADYSQKR